MSRTGSGMSMYRSAETSCMISSIGNSGARSAGPIGWSVPGCSTGAGGVGRSATMLYQAFGIFDSSSTYLTVSLMSRPPLVDEFGGYSLPDRESFGKSRDMAVPGMRRDDEGEQRTGVGRHLGDHVVETVRRAQQAEPPARRLPA